MTVEGIVLAGGLSSRVGKNKMLLDIQGKTVIEKSILGMYDICSRIIVVGGSRVEDIENILNKYPKVELIYNPEYMNGMFSSVKKGIENVKGDRFFLIPGDYPLVRSRTYRIMMDINEDIVIPLYGENRGHPLLMKSFLIKELLEDSYFESLRDFIATKQPSFIDVDDPGVLMDIDTMEDYESILHLLKV